MIPRAALAVALLVFGACSSDDGSAAPATTSTSEATSTTAEVATTSPPVDTCAVVSLDAVRDATGIAWEAGTFNGVDCIWTVTGTNDRLVVAVLEGAYLDGFFAVVYNNGGGDITVSGAVRAAAALVPDQAAGSHSLLAIERTVGSGVSVSLSSPAATIDQALAVAALVPA